MGDTSYLHGNLGWLKTNKNYGNILKVLSSYHQEGMTGTGGTGDTGDTGGTGGPPADSAI